MSVKELLSAWLKKSLAIATLSVAVSFLAISSAEAITDSKLHREDRGVCPLLAARALFSGALFSHDAV